MPSPLSAEPAVTVSIVTHRQWELVRPLLQQLRQHCAGTVARIVVTVNLPESTDIATDAGIPIDFIRNAAPKGFGANHNAAFARCTTPWFLVLNPDIRIDRDVIAPMLAMAEPRSGLVAPRIREPGKPGPEPFRDVLTPIELLRRRRAGHVPPRQPAWVAGMFMLLRSPVFAQLRGFDERFFMYCEDFDLCARMRLAGWQLQIAQDIEVLHDAQRASNKSLRPLLWHLASFARLWASATVWRYAALLRRTT